MVFLFSTVKHTVVKEESVSEFSGQKLDLTQRDPVDLTQDDCVEEPSEQLCLTEDCVKAGNASRKLACAIHKFFFFFFFFFLVLALDKCILLYQKCRIFNDFNLYHAEIYFFSNSVCH